MIPELEKLAESLTHRLLLLDNNRTAIMSVREQCMSRGDPASVSRCDEELHVIASRRLEVQETLREIRVLSLRTQA